MLVATMATAFLERNSFHQVRSMAERDRDQTPIAIVQPVGFQRLPACDAGCGWYGRATSTFATDNLQCRHPTWPPVRPKKDAGNWFAGRATAHDQRTARALGVRAEFPIATN